jgi:uncharacterized protein (TIGR03000 family)
MIGMRSSLKTGLLAAAGLLLAGSVALGGYRGVGYRGVGYYRPAYYGGYYRGLGYYGRPYAYGIYGRGYGYGLGYGGYSYGLGIGTGLGYALGYGGYAPAYGGIGYGGYSSAYGGYGYAAPGVAYPSGGYGYPATPYGNGSPDPYANPPSGTESNYPPAQQAVPQQAVPQRQLPSPLRNPQEEQGPMEDNTAHLTVVVPEGAELWFNGTKTSQTGTQREFDTPPLTPGQDFRYSIKARWTEGGRPVEVTRTVQVRANSSQVIDFTRPSRATAPEE